MKMYTPVLIESAEQADTLPEGTLAYGFWPDKQYGYGEVLRSRGAWLAQTLMEINQAPSEALVGWVAMVPVKTRRETMLGAYYPGIFGVRSQRLLERFVTYWEEA